MSKMTSREDMFKSKLSNQFKDKRADIIVEDVKDITRNCAKFVFSFNKERGNPSYKQLAVVFDSDFAELQPHLETATIKGDSLIVFASKRLRTRNFSDSKGMKSIIANLKFMEEELGTVWNVDKGDNGEQHLVEVKNFSIADLVKERNRRLGSVHAFTIEAIVTDIAPGYVVKFWNNNRGGVGTVEGLDGDFVALIVDGNKVKLHKDCIYKVVERTKQEEAGKEEYREDYWSKAIGPDFAQKLVKGE